VKSEVVMLEDDFTFHLNQNCHLQWRHCF